MRASARFALIAMAAAAASTVGAIDAEEFTRCQAAMADHEIFDQMTTAETITCSTVIAEHEIEQETRKHEEEQAAAKRAAEQARAQAEATRLREENERAEAEAARARSQAEAAARAKKAREQREASEAAERKRVVDEQAKIRSDAARKRASEEAARVASAVSTHREVTMKSNALKNCENELGKVSAEFTEKLPTCIPIDPMIAPLFGVLPLSGVLSTALLFIAAAFIALGCLAGSSTGTAWVTLDKTSKCKIKEVIIRPGSEVIVLHNAIIGPDIDMTGGSITVGDSVFQFDDGFNFARGTTIEIHAGPDAKSVKDKKVDEHDRFDSRRYSSLYWTSSSIFMETGHSSAVLKCGDDDVVSAWGQ